MKSDLKLPGAKLPDPIRDANYEKMLTKISLMNKYGMNIRYPNKNSLNETTIIV